VNVLLPQFLECVDLKPMEKERWVVPTAAPARNALTEVGNLREDGRLIARDLVTCELNEEPEYVTMLKYLEQMGYDALGPKEFEDAKRAHSSFSTSDASLTLREACARAKVDPKTLVGLYPWMHVQNYLEEWGKARGEGVIGTDMRKVMGVRSSMKRSMDEAWEQMVASRASAFADPKIAAFPEKTSKRTREEEPEPAPPPSSSSSSSFYTTHAAAGGDEEYEHEWENREEIHADSMEAVREHMRAEVSPYRGREEEEEEDPQ